MSAVVYRFTNDLRLEDHAGLAAAAQFGDIVPALVIDTDCIARMARSPRRAAFFSAAVAALDDALRERGTALQIRRGSAATALRRLARDFDASGVVWSAKYDKAGAEDDRRLQSALEEAGLRAVAVHDAAAVPPEDTSAAKSDSEGGYRAFVPYLDVWRDVPVASFEAPLLVRFSPIAASANEALPQPAEFGCGEYAEAPIGDARAALETFLRGAGLRYALALNAPAEDGTSHLASHLSFGTLSARTAVRETRRSCDDPFLLAEDRVSLRLFLRALAMRDFFLQLSWYYSYTQEEPLQEKMRDFTFAADHPALEAWTMGQTGYPAVDAGMRQLRATGWMHPRVRAIAASFLCFDLGVDWRAGRALWETLLIEDDPALATGNWQWIAGVGADMAQFQRIYTPRKYARRFDPTGAYVRRWVDELSHTPFGTAASSPAQMHLPFFGDDAYPKPVVDHDAAARAFLARYRAHVRA